MTDCGWDEGGRAIGFYKDGDCAGKVDDYTALTGGIAVTADDQYIFALRTERKLGESDPMWHGVARYTLDGKIITALAAMEEKVITTDTVFHCSGALNFGNRDYHCWKKEGHGRVDLRRAIVESCDVYFYQVGLRLGVDRIVTFNI